MEINSPQTVGDIPRLRASASPLKVAYSFLGQDTDFGTFYRHSNQVANGLVKDGVGVGARICYLGKNSENYFEILFGTAKAGAVLAPVNWRLAPPEISYILKDSQAEQIFVESEFLQLLDRSGWRGKVVVMDEGGVAGFEGWRDAQEVGEPSVEVLRQAPVLQIYTSGTTGRPKGAMLSHDNILGPRQKHGRDYPQWYQWSEADVVLIAVPVFHVGGTILGITTLLHGSRGVIARDFDPAGVLEYIEQEGITKLLMVPAALQILLNNPRSRQADYSRLKSILYGASPMPPDLLRECMAVFRCNFVQTYGMTETAGAVVALGPSDHEPNDSPRMRAAGRALPGVEIRIVDSSGSNLPTGTTGEILIRSIATMVGYFNQPEQTATAIDADAWLKTGDAGYLDDDGYLYVVDRVKDMIISGGENIYPAELERVLSQHPAVSEVAVIGVPDARWGEVPLALIVRNEGVVADSSNILRFARDHLASYKIPRTIEFVAQLPRNAGGKVLRRELRETYRQ
jgi:acyl-CoA synthetase (AMP-forming)/AMP-acid ligase II